MELQARARVWGRPRGRSGDSEYGVSSMHIAREDARVGAGTFSGAGTSKTVPTDASGIAKWKAAAESVEVTFESAEAVNKAMKAVWQSRAATPLDAYLAEGSDVVAVTSRPSAVEALGGDLFNSLFVAAAQSRTLTIRPAKKRAVLVEMHDTLFRTGSAVVNPGGEAPSASVGEHESITTVGLVATILRYNEEPRSSPKEFCCR